jgi:nucleoside-diphosphate-sugar epimerase
MIGELILEGSKRAGGDRKAGIRVLVTGGAGFIGSAVCRQFVREFGVTILNVDKLT